MAATVACHGADGGVPPVVAGCQTEPDVPACATAAAEVDATRAAILAAVAASRKAHAEAARAAAIEAKRAAVMAAVAAAKGADARKVTTKDLFGMDKVEGSSDSRSLAHEEVKEYRMQGNYGATKFIKP